jgi:hypothetical protein
MRCAPSAQIGRQGLPELRRRQRSTALRASLVRSRPGPNKGQKGFENYALALADEADAVTLSQFGLHFEVHSRTGDQRRPRSVRPSRSSWCRRRRLSALFSVLLAKDALRRSGGDDPASQFRLGGPIDVRHDRSVFLVILRQFVSNAELADDPELRTEIDGADALLPR